MGKFKFIMLLFNEIGIQHQLWNQLVSKTKVLLYIKVMPVDFAPYLYYW